MVRRFTPVFAMCSLFACNAIIGMDRAHLDPSIDAGTHAKGGGGNSSMQGSGGGPTGTSGGAGMSACAATPQRCSDCVASNCAAEKTACLADSTCRTALDLYTLCLTGKDCSNSFASCTEKLGASANLAAMQLGACLGLCRGDDACNGSTPITACEVYCECMSSMCADQFDNDLGGDVQKCINLCSGNPAISKYANCRAQHCEYAPYDALHCKHALGLEGWCPPAATLMIHTCSDHLETGLACLTNDDCCSLNCQRQVCQ